MRIHYRRPPGREQVFEQTLVHEGPSGPSGSGHDSPGRVLVTYLAESGLPRPVEVADRIVLERASPVVWLTFPGAHHDIGRFHTPAGQLTGFYANILTPVEIRRSAVDQIDIWTTTDLFLDLFLTPGGELHLLDRDELMEAVERGWIDEATARRAEDEARRLMGMAEAGEWPPRVAHEWTLDRAREVAAAAGQR